MMRLGRRVRCSIDASSTLREPVRSIAVPIMWLSSPEKVGTVEPVLARPRRTEETLVGSVCSNQTVRSNASMDDPRKAGALSDRPDPLLICGTGARGASSTGSSLNRGLLDQRGAMVVRRTSASEKVYDPGPKGPLEGSWWGTGRSAGGPPMDGGRGGDGG